MILKEIQVRREALVKFIMGVRRERKLTILLHPRKEQRSLQLSKLQKAEHKDQWSNVDAKLHVIDVYVVCCFQMT